MIKQTDRHLQVNNLTMKNYKTKNVEIIDNNIFERKGNYNVLDENVMQNNDGITFVIPWSTNHHKSPISQSQSRALQCNAQYESKLGVGGHKNENFRKLNGFKMDKMQMRVTNKAFPDKTYFSPEANIAGFNCKVPSFQFVDLNTCNLFINFSG